MSRNILIIVRLDWIELTANDVGAITLSNHGPAVINIMATAGPAPTTDDIPTGISITDDTAIISRTLIELFPGVTTPTRLWARVGPGSTGLTASVFVSHG